LPLSVVAAILDVIFRLFFNWLFAAIMKVILDSGQIEQVLKDLTGRILSETPAEMDIAVIGIRSRGEVLAQRLSGRLSQKLGRRSLPRGYRADYPRSSAKMFRVELWI